MPPLFDVLDQSVRDRIYTQNYDPVPTIDGVKIIQLTHITGEDSDFSEVMRFRDNGESELFPGFHIRQLNRSTQQPGSIKAWHLHILQDEIWYVPEESRLTVAVWDIRKNSPTHGKTMRFVMGPSRTVLYIPHGVAHGSANVSNSLGVIIYVMNGQFDKKNPDEHRIPWDAKGADFWKPPRD